MSDGEATLRALIATEALSARDRHTEAMTSLSSIISRLAIVEIELREIEKCRVLLHGHLEDHSIEPQDVGLPAGSWDPMRYDPYVAPERMQIRRRGSRVMVLAVALLGAIVGLAHPATGAKIEKLLTVLR